jgi:hypothetical protein
MDGAACLLAARHGQADIEARACDESFPLDHQIARADTAAMEIHLTDEEVAALCHLLDAHFRELTAEISHTDNPGFRQRLRKQRDVLLGVRERFKSASNSAARAG